MSTNRVVNVAIIGAGEIAMCTHLPTLGFLSHLYEVTAIVDISKQAVEHCGRKFNIPRTFTDVPEMLAACSDVDMVLICHSDEFHAVHAVQCLNAGKHLFIEKPMAQNLREADDIEAAHVANGKLVFVGYMRRYATAFLRFKEAVSKLDPAEINYVRFRNFTSRVPDGIISQSGTYSKRFSDYPEKSSAERREFAKSQFEEYTGLDYESPVAQYIRACKFHLSPHDLSLMRELFGLPRRIIAAVPSARGNFLSVMLQYGVVLGMFMFQNWSGSISINYYSPILFRSLLISDVSLYTGIYGVCRSTAAIAFYAYIVDYTGRRVPWLISAMACSLTLLYIAIFTTVADTTSGTPTASVRSAGTGATAMIMLYGIFWSFGGNGLPWIVAAEIFPARLRPITGAFAASLQWFFSFILTLAIPYMIGSDMGPNGVFYFFSALCFMTAVFTFVWVPETKAVPIESCEALFSGKMRHAAWRSKSLYPPNGIPPLPDHIAAGEAAYIQAHQASSSAYDFKTKDEHNKLESV